MSNVGQIVEATPQTRGISKAAIAEIFSVRSQMDGKMASLLVQAEATMSCIIGEVSQRLEQGLEAVASGSIATSMRNMLDELEGLRQELQVKFIQDQAELQQRQVEASDKMEEITNIVQELTQQLNNLNV